MSIGLIPEGTDPGRLVFFDLETTGLSSGAGSVAFLAGFGRIRKEGLRLQQLFLADYPGEGEFLRALRERLRDEDVIVSYNGRGFDMQVLKTRLIMHGMAPIRSAHGDLLYPARKLWRRLLPDCSLGTVEGEVLDVARELDIPGAEVPEAYFEYLRSGRSSRLEAVVSHHEQDILSLVRLLWYLEAYGIGREPAVRVDRYELGRFLTREHCSGATQVRGLEVLEGLLLPNHPDALRAALHLGTYYRRAGHWDRAEEVWRFAFEVLRSVDAAVALAKLQEHRRRDPRRALEIVETVLAWPHARPWLAGLTHRRERLQHKVAGARRGRPASRRATGGSQR